MSDLPEVPDLVIISIPSVLVNPVVEECGEFGVKNMVVITAGFKEIGGEGVERENELVALGQKYGINIIGPNSLGITDSHSLLNASFSQIMPPTGNIAFISQSGAMMVAIIDWSVTSGIGFSKIISLGNKAGIIHNHTWSFPWPPVFWSLKANSRCPVILSVILQVWNMTEKTF